MALAPGYGTANHTAAAAVLQIVGTGSQTRSGGGVYRSTDAGATWQAVGSPGLFDHGATAVAIAPDGRLFGGYLKDGGTVGLLCNTGALWQVSCPPVGHFNGGGAARCGAGACPAGGAAAGTGNQQGGTAAGAGGGPGGAGDGAGTAGRDASSRNGGGLLAGTRDAASSRPLLVPAVATCGALLLVTLMLGALGRLRGAGRGGDSS
jgi:hypothetical protein